MTATLGDDSACAAAGDETFSGRSVAEVRAGHLLVRWDGPAGYCWKLLLRYLNLTATEDATYGFSLVRPGSVSPIVTVVVSIYYYPVYKLYLGIYIILNVRKTNRKRSIYNNILYYSL